MPVPLRQTFDYLPTADGSLPARGVRVLAPFGRSERVGVVLGTTDAPDVHAGRLKPIARVIDLEPVLDEDSLTLLERAAAYYQHPIGDVIATALPTLLRKGEASQSQTEMLRATGQAGDLSRAPKQAEILAELTARQSGMPRSQVRARGFSPSALKALQDKELVRAEIHTDTPHVWQPTAGLTSETLPTLNPDQKTALEITHTPGTHLVYGVTGSGKTEVYLRTMESVLAAGRQALVLVPEIGLTPQTIRRFARRFDAPVEVLHSGLTDNERLAVWRAAGDGSAAIVIGTRSAIFTRFRDLGIIVIDEEHDPSYKQMDGFRYSARDLAVMRGARGGIPVVLGSATPSLESYANARSGRYTFTQLPIRAGGAALPPIRRIDVRQQHVRDGLSAPMQKAVREHLTRGDQVLIFLNRRGYAEALICRACGWLADCPRCDARLTWHRDRNQVICHHCGTTRQTPTKCPDCDASTFAPLGAGTQRVETGLKGIFPETRIIRIDRDTTRGKRALEDRLKEINSAGAAILVGTQLLAKGHHFPNVTLVAILDADAGFFSADFKAMERMGQLIVQVSGRAGRAEKPGQVILQTHVPDHPALDPLLKHDYLRFADQLLESRRTAGLPPGTFCALMRAEATQQAWPMRFLSEIRTRLTTPTTELWGPVPAPMERRQGRFRAQLLLIDPSRPRLARSVAAAIDLAKASSLVRRVRWSVDVDPIDLS